MFRFDADLRIYLHRDPFARAVFAFHNRKRDRVKLLLYDRAGFWLLLNYLASYYDSFGWIRGFWIPQLLELLVRGQ